MNTFGKQLEHHLAKVFDFDLTTLFSYTNNNLWIPVEETIKTYHECGTSACVVGHAMLLTGKSLTSGDVAELLGIPAEYHLSFKSALNFSSSARSQAFWNKRLEQVTSQEAADFIRHINTHKAIPRYFKDIEQHYSAFELYKPENKIYWTASANNITGIGTNEQQAILDYVEQLIAKDLL